jgi:hypothetical protein
LGRSSVAAARDRSHEDAGLTSNIQQGCIRDVSNFE